MGYKNQPFRSYFKPEKSIKKTPQPLSRNSKRRKPREIPGGLSLSEWFQGCRQEMTGYCQCGCGNESQKWSEATFGFSIAHIFPKKKFPHLATLIWNWVERAWIGGCHSVMDEAGMDKWPGMADWETIKEKVRLMEPYLTEKDKASKFYLKLKGLIDDDNRKKE